MQKQPPFSTRFILRILLTGILFAWSFGTTLRAQDIDFSGACPFPGAFSFPPVATGSPMTAINIAATNTPMGSPATLTIQNVSVEIGGVEFSICSSCSSPVTFPPSDFAITSSGPMITLQGTPPASMANNIVIFTIRAIANGTPCDKTFRLPLTANRAPVALALVLDQSGSMSLGFDGGAAAAGQRRWDGLVTAAGVLSERLGFNMLPKPDDKLAMILFSSGLNPSPSPFNVPTVSLETNHSQLSPKLMPLSPSGNTALGNGILEARDRLLSTPAGTRKVMFVFSDGVQNTGDEVRTDTYTHTVSNQDISGGGAIEIYTICLGSSGHNPALMQGIANANNGTSKITPAGQEANFLTYLDETLTEVFSANSPQFIDTRKGSFPQTTEGSSTVTQTFHVSKGSKAVNVAFIVPDRYEAAFTSVKKNGTEIIQFTPKSRGFGYIMAGLKFPAYGVSGSLDGEYSVTVRIVGAKDKVPYTCSIVTDDHALHTAYTTEKESHNVGDTLRPRVMLTRLGKPWKNATVEVIVGKPGDDVNDLIALSNVSAPPNPSDPGSPDAAKLAELLKDSAFVNKIRVNNQIFSLSYNAGSDEYTGSFSGLDVTGVYPVIYRVTANDSLLGNVQRYHQKTLYVRFKDVDLPKSNIVITVNAAGNAVLNWRPMAGNNKLIGVGWGKALRVEGANIASQVDNGDGSYTVDLGVPPQTEVKITLLDEPVYTGPIKDFGQGSDECKILNIPCWLFWTLVVLIILLILWLIFRKK